jgi:hypothetical protein
MKASLPRFDDPSRQVRAPRSVRAYLCELLQCPARRPASGYYCLAFFGPDGQKRPASQQDYDALRLQGCPEVARLRHHRVIS